MTKKALYLSLGLLFIILSLTFFKIVKTANTLVDIRNGQGTFYLVKKFKNESNWLNELLPSQQKLERGDVIVFYNPTINDIPLKKKNKLVGRLIGLPGDVVNISNKEISINNQIFKEWYPLYFKYRVSFEGENDKSIIETVKKHKNILLWEEIIEHKAYEFIATPKVADEISNIEGIVNLRMINMMPKEYVMDYYPKVPNVLWNKDHYGPVYIPQKNVTLVLTNENIGVYKKLIDVFENHTIFNDLTKIEIDGNIVDRYIFEKDYYFVLNDNRDSGIDSRYYGFVPADHIIGRAVKK